MKINNNGFILIEILLDFSISLMFIYSILIFPIQLIKDYNIFSNHLNVIYDIELNSKKIYNNNYNIDDYNFDDKFLYYYITEDFLPFDSFIYKVMNYE